MSIDLTGITNKNEYYTYHYFSTVFEENTSATISGWNAAARESEEIKTPWSLLRQNARQYYTAHDKFVRSSVNLQVLANSANICSGTATDSFISINNLFAVSTIDECFEVSNAQKPVPNIKDANNNWEKTGHPDRVVRIGKKELLLFAQIFDGNDIWESARLPVIHAKQLVDVLKRFRLCENTLKSQGEKIIGTSLFSEPNALQEGMLERSVHFGENAFDFVYSGPHIGLANPLVQTSRRICDTNRSYDPIDLTEIPANYLQRCNYRPSVPIEQYSKKVPNLHGRSILDDYRVAWRSMLNQAGERAMIPAIIPPKSSHIDLVYEVASSRENTCIIAGTFASIPFDYYIKSTGKAHARFDVVGSMPLLSASPYNKHIRLRALLLNCLTKYYADLWLTEWDDEFSSYSWLKNDSRLPKDNFSQLSSNWNYSTPLRTDYQRRQALVELDVITAMALGMTLNQLKTIYCIQFPVLQQYEADTWYDTNGRIVFTNNRSLTGVGFSRPEWENGIQGAPAGKKFYRTITDDTMPGGPVERTIEYVAPFDRCDREQDYETAWKFFDEKYREG